MHLTQRTIRSVARSMGALAAMTFAVILWPASARAEALPLSLDEAVERALKGAPQIAASSATVQSAESSAESAGRLPDPELIAGIDNLPVDTAERFSLTRDFMTMEKIGIMQSVPNRAKRRARRDYAQREIDVAQGSLRKSRFDVARATAEAWIARATTEESLKRLRELRPDTELQASAAKAALASGRTSTAEVLAAQTLVAKLDDRILSLEQDLAMRRAELARWIGDDAGGPLAAIPSDRDLGPSPEALIEQVPEHAPLAPILAQVEAAKTDVELARAEKRPDWSTEFTYQNRGPDFSKMVSLEFRIGLPLFGKHRQDPVIAGKLAALRAQEATRDAEIRMHRAEIAATLEQWRQGRERLRRYTADLLPLSQDRARAALSSYQSGRGDLRTALDALREEVDTQLEYVELQGAVARAWTFLHFLHDGGHLE